MSEEPNHKQATASSVTEIPVDLARPVATKTNLKLLVGMVLFVVIVVGVISGIVYVLFTHQSATATIRDIFIIALALVSFLIGILMMVLVFQLQQLIVLLRNEIKPMLTNANETVNTVRGTAAFVSDNLVKPTIGVASFLAGIRGIQQAIINKVSSTGGKSRQTGKTKV